jgi:hypothetical protein
MIESSKSDLFSQRSVEPRTASRSRLHKAEFSEATEDQMAGAYAHLTLVNLLKETPRLEAIPNFPKQAIIAVLDYFKFCELGSVSPDYPYLAVGDKKAERWADLMHKSRTGAMIQAGIEILKMLPKDEKQKGLAWLLGYSAHVATDVSIHPVVNLKVGPYKTNKRHHRICELHQDAYIFQRLKVGAVGLSEHLDSGISACSNPEKKDQLDPHIWGLWNSMLERVHEKEFKANPPDINKWHSSFTAVVDKVEESGRLMPFARHLGVKCGITYPNPNEVDRKEFIDTLKVPGKRQMSYDQIFDVSIRNVGGVWQTVAAGVFDNDQRYATRLTTWNLDTGKDESKRMVFWS